MTKSGKAIFALQIVILVLTSLTTLGQVAGLIDNNNGGLRGFKSVVVALEGFVSAGIFISLFVLSFKYKKNNPVMKWHGWIFLGLLIMWFIILVVGLIVGLIAVQNNGGFENFDEELFKNKMTHEFTIGYLIYNVCLITAVSWMMYNMNKIEYRIK